MPICIETRLNHLHVHWSGVITPSDLAQLLGELPERAARCGFTPHVLHTIDDAAELGLETLEAFNGSKRCTHTPIPVPNNAAFVAHSPAAVAIARPSYGFNKNPNLAMKSFPNEEAALSWLGLPSPGVQG